MVPIQQGTLEMRDEVLSSVGAQDMDRSRYQVSDLEDIEFDWEEPDLNMDTVFRTGIDTPFSPPALKEFELGSMAEIPILIDEEQDKENSPPIPATPVSDGPFQTPVLMRNCHCG